LEHSSYYCWSLIPFLAKAEGVAEAPATAQAAATNSVVVTTLAVVTFLHEVLPRPEWSDMYPMWPVTRTLLTCTMTTDGSDMIRGATMRTTTSITPGNTVASQEGSNVDMSSG